MCGLLIIVDANKDAVQYFDLLIYLYSGLVRFNTISNYKIWWLLKYWMLAAYLGSRNFKSHSFMHRMHTKFRLEELGEICHSVKQSLGGRIMFKLIINKRGVDVWTKYSRINIGFNCKHFWTRRWTLELNENRQLLDRLSNSQIFKEDCVTEFVMRLKIQSRRRGKHSASLLQILTG